MKKKYLQFCDLIAKACGAFAVMALLLSLVIVELVFERYFFQSNYMANRTCHNVVSCFNFYRETYIGLK